MNTWIEAVAKRHSHPGIKDLSQQYIESAIATLNDPQLYLTAKERQAGMAEKVALGELAYALAWTWIEAGVNALYIDPTEDLWPDGYEEADVVDRIASTIEKALMEAYNLFAEIKNKVEKEQAKETGQFVPVLIEDEYWFPHDPAKKTLARFITVCADPDMKKIIESVKGIESCHNHHAPSRYTVYLDPRYDREVVKRNIKDAIILATLAKK